MQAILTSPSAVFLSPPSVHHPRIVRSDVTYVNLQADRISGLRLIAPAQPLGFQSWVPRESINSRIEPAPREPGSRTPEFRDKEQLTLTRLHRYLIFLLISLSFPSIAFGDYHSYGRVYRWRNLIRYTSTFDLPRLLFTHLVYHTN
jgi:hypothetical protein